jgi:hypothetical protein
MPITRRGFLKGALAAIGGAVAGKALVRPGELLPGPIGDEVLGLAESADGWAAGTVAEYDYDYPAASLRSDWSGIGDIRVVGTYGTYREFPGIDTMIREPVAQTIRLGNEDGSALVSTDSGYSWHNEEELCQF